MRYRDFPLAELCNFSLAGLLPGKEKFFLPSAGSKVITFFLLEMQGTSLLVDNAVDIEWWGMRAPPSGLPIPFSFFLLDVRDLNDSLFLENKEYYSYINLKMTSLCVVLYYSFK